MGKAGRRDRIGGSNRLASAILVGAMAVLTAACDTDPSSPPMPTTGFVSNQRIVYSDGLHNENTDLIEWNGAFWMVFRGGEEAQNGSPLARLKVFRSDDRGDTWTMTAEVFMPDRDIRDPKFVVQDGRLVLYACSRVPGAHVRDAGGLAWAVRTESADGVTWPVPVRVCDETWMFWRIVRHDGAWFATGYNDGDVQVGLFRSTDGRAWEKVSLIFDSEPDVPSEAELHFRGDTAIALVRLDNGTTLLEEGHTAICVATKPFASWDCGRVLDKRLDGPNWFTHGGREIVIARKHLPDAYKRTAVYELKGDLADPAAPITLVELQELQSAGDTSYVGVAPLGHDQFLVSWYSSDVAEDPNWLLGMFSPSDIWTAWLDLSKG